MSVMGRPEQVVTESFEQSTGGADRTKTGSAGPGAGRRWWVGGGLMYVVSAVAWEVLLWAPRAGWVEGILIPGAGALSVVSLLYLVGFGAVLIIAAGTSARTAGRRAGGIILSCVALVLSLLPVIQPVQYRGFADGTVHFPPLATFGVGLSFALISLIWMVLVFLSWALTWPIRGTGYLGILLVVASAVVGFYMGFVFLGHVGNVLIHVLVLLVLPGFAVLVALLASRASERRAAARVQQQAAAITQPAQVPHTNTMAVLGLVFAFVFSVLGVIFSHVGLSQIARTGEGGRGLAIAGLAVGYTAIALGVIVVIWQLVLLQSVMSGFGV